MDYQTLSQLLQKKSSQWSIPQTSKWLQFINLPHLITSFQQAGIDGSCIHCLDQDILKNQLNIKSAIVRKKLINWINVGLQAFDKFISANIGAKGLILPVIPLKKTLSTCVRNQSKTKLSSHNQVSSFIQQSSSQNIQSYMILQQIQGNGIGCNIIKNQILSIGFGRYNNITSLQTSISQKHALIGYKNYNFFLQDLGSKFGTFIKINHRALLKYGIILQIGSYQFKVVTIQRNIKLLKLKQIYYCPDDQQSQNNKNQSNLNQLPHNINLNNRKNNIKKINTSNINSSKSQTKIQQFILDIDLNQKNKFTFGRRKENDFQKDDKHMSGMHCKITYFNDNFYIEDYGSTNGTWIRISPEYTISPQIPIETDCIIKLGAAISYSCKIITDPKTKSQKNPGKIDTVQMVDQNHCKICKCQQNNCLFLPCSHNICCIQCSFDIGERCPQCAHQIAQKIKIHK